MTYVRWKRELILSTIDQFLASTSPAAEAPSPQPQALEPLLQQLSRGLPRPEILATMRDLLQAHRNLCSEQQLAVMRELTLVASPAGCR